MSVQPLPLLTDPIDPNEKQRIASNPVQSVWVDASAGTGKTKILTDRVLRLLLSDETRSASPPERIVCITFTKAAAAEMSLRITKELSAWSICSDEGLLSSLEDLMGHLPSAQQAREARTLFARVIDVAGGLKIMTIHAFCQSILQKFPLEAGLSPNFTILTAPEAKASLQTARLHVLRQAKHAPESLLGQAVQSLSVKSGDMQLMQFLEDALKEQAQILPVFEALADFSDLKPALFDAAHLPKETSAEHMRADFFKNTPKSDLKIMIEAYEDYGTQTEQEKVRKLSDFLSETSQTYTNIQQYADIFLKKDLTLRKKMATQKVLKAYPEMNMEDILLKEGERCLAFFDIHATLHMVEDTHDFLCVAHAILKEYAHEKTKRNGLDFDDLIRATHALLKHSKTAAQWVLFKLDQGIDHLLVDEAQDTNPEQWSVIEALSDEFFHGASARDSIERTLFVVGDEKQSIYSFQKADPDVFRHMQSLFKEKVNAASKTWEDVPLTLSFRSTEAVLALVDLVFAQEDMRPALTAHNSDIHHEAFRQGMAGHVELWPLLHGEEKEELPPWPIPRTPTHHTSAADLMAQKIAGTIKHWLDSGRLLESENRPIRAGDIMILLKKRSVFQKNLVRSLKAHNIPVGGLDRMVLQDHIAVQDVLVALEFGLLPQDNLTLATLLKSPLIGWDDTQLMHFILDHPDAPSLWHTLKTHSPEIHAYLLDLHSLILTHRPFDGVSFILNTPCPADPQGSGLHAFIKRLGTDAIDPLQELLNTSIDAESNKGISIQAFVHDLKKETQEIKREMDDGSNAIRIMTIHGSKGLQAPIVFLPDTIRTAQSRDNALQAGSKLLWPRRSSLSMPFWAPRSAPSLFKDAKKRALERDDCEYQRLLYVALTRARDELYISGYTPTEKRSYLEDSWYCTIKSAMEGAQDTGVRAPCILVSQDGTITLSNPQTQPTDNEKQPQTALSFAPLPPWSQTHPKAEPSPLRPLQPSRPSGEVKSMSPLASHISHARFKRGTIIHTLLEFLPDCPEAARKSATEQYLSHTGHGLSQESQSEITQEILKILNDPVFAPVFGKNSRAEVSISGQIGDNTIVNGQIDRLIITDTEIFIVDYKTNRPPPTDPKDIPAQYQKQMQAYKDVLTQIYPTHTIRTALLWTNRPVLMEIRGVPFKS